MAQTLEQQAAAHDNDFRGLEAIYRDATGSELVRAPYESVRHGPALTLSASVVIPAWNARDTIEACLIAIEQSTFNQKYPEQLEVVVVDDGSTDDTWATLERLRLGVRLKAVQQVHHSRAQTQNTGIAVAEGDVIISCDADMLLTPFAIEELVKRHQLLPRVMLLGFRGDVERRDPRIQPHALPRHLPGLLPPFEQDVRLRYGAGGWPTSMCRDSDHLQRLGQRRSLWMADGSRWNLPGVVYGALFSLHRDEWRALGGYDERFYGWGCEDTLVGVRALALRCHVLPVYSAAGLHIAHPPRSARKWQEFAANRRVFGSILRSPFQPHQGPGWAQARRRIRRQIEREPACVERDAPGGCWLDPFDRAWADPDRRGKILYTLGRYEEAAAAFAEITGPDEATAWAHFDEGKALRAAGQPEAALARLDEAAGRLPESAWPAIEGALALAALGRFEAARERLDRAWHLEPTNAAVAFLLQPPDRHLARADFYAQQGNHALALRDYEAALIQTPHHAGAQTGRALALAALGRPEAAKRALGAFVGDLPLDGARDSAAYLDLARLHQATGEAGIAKVVLERARRLHPRDAAVRAELDALQTTVARAFPLPRPDRIAAAIDPIPGWLGADEAELLAALAMRAVARCDGGPPRLVEIGRYCGRATVTLALAAQSLGRDDAQIVAVAEPTLGAAPDGRPAQEWLREALAAHDVEAQVILAPEAEPEPWAAPSHLLLVDGQHDYASVRADMERYAPQLVAGGLLLFHDYADYFPDVQRCVDELLLDSAFAFVAQASSLIALVRRPAGTTHTGGAT